MDNSRKSKYTHNFRYLALFCLIEFVFAVLLHVAWQHNRDSYLANRATHLQTSVASVIDKYQAVAHAINHEVIEKPDILRLQAEAIHAGHTRRVEIHDELYQKLSSTYQRLQQENPLHIQLVLPDGTSLLRLHEPRHWGDQLHPYRDVIRQANSSKKEIIGYETGRYAVGAHRYAFPLLLEGTHIGTVEFSLFATTLIEQLDRQNKQSSWFMLVQRTIAIPKLITDKNLDSMELSDINSDYLEVQLSHPQRPLSSAEQLQAPLYHNKTIKKRTSKHILFSTEVGNLNGVSAAAVFIPISNFQGQHAAYLVGIGSAPILDQFDRNMPSAFVVGSLLLAGIMLLVRRQAFNGKVLREERETLSAITSAMGEGLLVQDITGYLLYMNPKAEELLGYCAEDLKAGSVHTLIYRHSENELGQCPILHATAHGQSYTSLEEQFATSDGRMLPVEVIATPLVRSGVHAGSVTLFRDISQQKAAQQQLVRMNKLYAALSATNHAIVHIAHVDELYHEICLIAVEHAGFESAYVGLFSKDGNSLIPVAAAGSSSSIGTEPITLRHADRQECMLLDVLTIRQSHVCRKRCILSGIIERSGVCLGNAEPYIGAYPLSCDGKVVSALVLYSADAAAFDAQQTALLEEMAQDVSFALDSIHRFEQHRQAQDKLQRISNFDALTGLPNRTLLLDRIDQAITVAEKNDSSLGLLLIGLDRFKDINNSFGYAVGDQVLCEIAQRLEEFVPRGITLARPGGDEFLVLVPDVVITDCVHLTGKLLSAISEKPILIEEQTVTVSARAGISVWPDDADNGADLLRNANTALNRAKSGDEASYQFFTADMTTISTERLTLENDLRHALQEQQFVVYYQPKIDIKSRKLSGCEALVRWQHPKQGLVGPNWFIPLMEEIGLIAELGDRVLREACRQAVLWNHNGYENFCMAVNLSPVQMKHGAIVDDVRKTLQDTGLPPSQLELEITESTAMHDVKRTLSVIEDLKSLGIKIAIDDFGTGYSSLSQLKRLSADTLKIDRSFIMNLPDDREDCVIADTILALAKNLGMDVVAEGVETAEQLAFLQSRECRYVQGYYYAKPMPAEEFEKFMKTHNDDLTLGTD